MTKYHGVLFGIIPNKVKSISPPENVIPILTFNICIIINDKPANTQCIPNNTGATNKNVNSIGSVIPVKNEVNAADAIIPATYFFFSGFASCTIAKAAAGSPNIINGNLPVINVPAVNSTPSLSCANHIL